MTTQKHADFISDQVLSAEYYYLNLTPPPKASRIVVCGGREQCTPNYCIDRAGFRFHSIEFVSSGKGTLTIHGRTWPLELGAIFCYGPGIAHRIESDPDAPLLKHFIDFTGAGLVVPLRQLPLYRTPLYCAQPFRMRNLFETLLQTGTSDSRHRDALCVLLLRQLMLHADEDTLPIKDARSPAWQTYLRCRVFIEQHFLELGTIRQVAEQCHLDKAYLCRLFKRYTNETPLQLLTRLKMHKATDLLTHRNLLIKQAGTAVGYQDPYHFSKAFKRVYGIAPRTFIRATSRSHHESIGNTTNPSA